MGGGYGCMGGGYGCMGGGYGCYGGGMYGCAGGFGCYGGGMVIQGGGGGEKKDKTEKIPPPGDEISGPATIVVNLPAEARLMVDGHRTTSTSTQRRLVSPTLQPGREFRYTLTAEIVRDGKTIRESRPVTVRANRETQVQFTFTEATTTASR
jgi:uncharacterized protein (TIGR03000 family)